MNEVRVIPPFSDASEHLEAIIEHHNSLMHKVLDLSMIYLGSMSTKKLVQAFTLIGPLTKKIILHLAGWHKKSMNELISIMETLHYDFVIIQIDSFDARRYTSDELKRFYNLLSRKCQALLLTLNQWLTRSSGLVRGDFPLIFSHLSRNLTVLNLASNNLGALGEKILSEAVGSMTHLRSLFLSNNSLSSLSDRDLIGLIKAVPRDLKVLGLSYNELYRKGSILGNALFFLPEGLESFSLRGNKIGLLDDEDFKTLFVSIRRMKNLTTLSLASNFLESLETMQMCFMLSHIPPSVTWLHINDNFFPLKILLGIFKFFMKYRSENKVYLNLDRRQKEMKQHAVERFFNLKRMSENIKVTKHQDAIEEQDSSKDSNKRKSSTEPIGENTQKALKPS